MHESGRGEVSSDNVDDAISMHVLFTPEARQGYFRATIELIAKEGSERAGDVAVRQGDRVHTIREFNNRDSDDFVFESLQEISDEFRRFLRGELSLADLRANGIDFTRVSSSEIRDAGESVGSGWVSYDFEDADFGRGVVGYEKDSLLSESDPVYIHPDEDVPYSEDMYKITLPPATRVTVPSSIVRALGEKRGRPSELMALVDDLEGVIRSFDDSLAGWATLHDVD